MAFQMAGSLYPKKRFAQPRTNRAYKAPKAPVTPTIPAAYAKAHVDLMNYNGTFNFLLDTRHKLMKYGSLSDKQWEAVVKCLTSTTPVQSPVDQILVESCNIPITINPTAARVIAKANKWPINPCTLMVTQVKSKNSKGLTVRAKINWTGNVGVCRCCNKTLTDWRSQATGVGPYCVKRTGISYVRNQADITRFQKEMEDLCNQLGEVEFFIKNWSILGGRKDLDTIIRATTPTKIDTSRVDAVVPFTRFDWDAKTRILSCKSSLLESYFPDFSKGKMPNILGVHNSKTKNTANFLFNADSKQAVGSKYTAYYISVSLENPIKLHVYMGS